MRRVRQCLPMNSLVTAAHLKIDRGYMFDETRKLIIYLVEYSRRNI